jgi:signal transduction histidine kinase
MFRSTSLRLAALYTSVFASSVVLLGAITLLTMHAALKAQFEARIQAEVSALGLEFRTEGLTGVVQAIQERYRTPGTPDYGLTAPDGKPLAGLLARERIPLGWSKLQPYGGRSGRSLRVLSTVLPEGYVLRVGDDDSRPSGIERTVLAGFIWAFAGVVVLGILGGIGLSYAVHRRLSAMSNAAEAIIGGDFARRIPLRGSDDDLDRLGATFNRMLDRIGRLMDSLRQVSNDVAHDLRTPLNRLRHRLEASRQTLTADERTAAIEGALSDVDAILETFDALLRIAQIESGGRRGGFRAVDIGAIACTVVDDFAPSAEDSGHDLRLDVGESLTIEGDPELLTLMLVNLVDNALRHTGPQASVRVRLASHGEGAILSVTDNGPGIPIGERERVLDRFYRLERSRSTPGSGLGLALAAAIARLHDGTLSLGEAHPGLAVSVVFPAASGRGTLGIPNPTDRSPSAQAA